VEGKENAIKLHHSIRTLSLASFSRRGQGGQGGQGGQEGSKYFVGKGARRERGGERMAMAPSGL